MSVYWDGHVYVAHATIKRGQDPNDIPFVFAYGLTEQEAQENFNAALKEAVEDWGSYDSIPTIADFDQRQVERWEKRDAKESGTADPQPYVEFPEVT